MMTTLNGASNSLVVVEADIPVNDSRPTYAAQVYDSTSPPPPNGVADVEEQARPLDDMSLKPPPSAAATDATTTAAAAASSSSKPAAATAAAAGSKLWLWLVLGLVGVVVLIAAGVGVGLEVGGNNDSSTSAASSANNPNNNNNNNNNNNPGNGNNNNSSSGGNGSGANSVNNSTDMIGGANITSNTDFTPDAGRAPTAAPTTVVQRKCPDQGYETCLLQGGKLSRTAAIMCVECVNAALNVTAHPFGSSSSSKTGSGSSAVMTTTSSSTTTRAASTGICNTLQDDFCPAFLHCNCGGCTQQIVDWIDCSIPLTLTTGTTTSSSSNSNSDNGDQSCALDCGTPAPTPAPGSGGSGGSGSGSGSSNNNNNSAQCTSDKTAYRSCLKDLSDFEALTCVDCINMALNFATGSKTCDDFTTYFCPAYSMCNCGDCGNLIQTWIDCVVSGNQCGLNCMGGGSGVVGGGGGSNGDETSSPGGGGSNGGGETSSPGGSGSSPTQSNVCPTETSTYQTCLNQTMSSTQADSCVACVNSILDQAPTDTCDDFSTSFCTNFVSCQEDCGSCTDGIEQWVDCAIGQNVCLLNCDGNTGSGGSGSTGSTGASSGGSESTGTSGTGDGSNSDCSHAEEDYQSCLDTLAWTQGTNCVDCINQAYRDASRDSCGQFTDDFCTAAEDCGCGACTEQLEFYVGCSMADTNCVLDCNPSEPAAAPIPQDPCVATAKVYQKCLKSLSSSDAKTCVNCVNTAINSTKPNDDTCDMFTATNFCSDFASCESTCGDCTSSILDWMDCALSGGDGSSCPQTC